jgi:hypothetical protein
MFLIFIVQETKNKKANVRQQLEGRQQRLYASNKVGAATCNTDVLDIYYTRN